jgi:zinc protease
MKAVSRENKIPLHIAAMLDRRIAPPSRIPGLPVLRRPETEILPNGIELSRFLSEDQSITELELLFPAESHLAEIRQKEGFVFRMLGEGTRAKTAKQLADAISFLGASLEFSHHPDYDHIHISCLSRFFMPMLGILEEIWAEPVFPEKEWKTMQETQIRQHEVNLQKTSFLASRLMKEKLYSHQLDYGYSTDPAFISGIQRDELPELFSKLCAIGPALALLAGHAEKEAVLRLRDWLSSFTGCRQMNRLAPAGLPTVEPGIHWEEKSGSNQSSLRMGHFTIDSRHKDSALLGLTLEVFGGYFGSRLMSNIREDKGWTYGIYAQRVANQGQPYLVVSCDVHAESSLLAVQEILHEAAVLQQEPVGTEELEKVKNYMLGQYLSSLTHVYGYAERYKAVWVNGTSFERVEENQRIIREATTGDLQKMASLYLNFKDTIICLSGQKSNP